MLKKLAVIALVLWSTNSAMEGASANAESANGGQKSRDGIPPVETSAEETQFLHDWACRASAAYKRAVEQNDCKEASDVTYLNGHVVDIQQIQSCGPAKDEAFKDAILNTLQRSIAPSNWIGLMKAIRFVEAGKDNHACDR